VRERSGARVFYNHNFKKRAMPTLLSLGGPGASLSDQDVRSALLKVFEGLGGRERVLLVPPDATRGQSRAGLIAAAAYEHYGSAVKDVLPALGTHVPMSPAQIAKMYPGRRRQRAIPRPSNSNG
jgi:hypothetical protein